MLPELRLHDDGPALRDFLRSTNINFARTDSAGWDFTASYSFDIGTHGFDVSVQGTKVDELNFFTNPSDLSEVDVELGEIGDLRFAGASARDPIGIGEQGR